MSKKFYICLISDPVSQKPLTLIKTSDIKSAYKGLIESIRPESDLSEFIAKMISMRVVPELTILEECSALQAEEALMDWLAHFEKRGVLLIENDCFDKGNSFNGIGSVGRKSPSGFTIPFAKNSTFWKEMGISRSLKKTNESIHSEFFKRRDQDEDLRTMLNHNLEISSIADILGCPSQAVEQRIKFLGLH